MVVLNSGSPASASLTSSGISVQPRMTPSAPRPPLRVHQGCGQALDDLHETLARLGFELPLEEDT
jgi:hypothetical protein